MACAKLWPDKIIVLKLKAQRCFMRFQLWSHKLFVKWALLTSMTQTPIECHYNCHHMMMSWHENTFPITGPLCEESTSHLWNPHHRGPVSMMWSLICCYPEQAVEPTVNVLVIWNALLLLWCHCNVLQLVNEQVVYSRSYCCRTNVVLA